MKKKKKKTYEAVEETILGISGIVSIMKHPNFELN